MKRTAKTILGELRRHVTNGQPYLIVGVPKHLATELEDAFNRWRETWILPALDELEKKVAKPTKTTTAAVNTKLFPYGMEIVRGQGYYYFVSVPGEVAHPINSGVEQGCYDGTPRITDRTVDQWVEVGLSKVREAFEHHRVDGSYDEWVKLRTQ